MTLPPGAARLTAPSAPVLVRADDGFDPPNDFTLGDLLRAALRHRRTVARAVLVGAVLGLLAWALTPRRYVSASALMAQSRRPQQALSGLAAQFGINIGQPDGGLSPAVYADLLGSRELLGAVVDTAVRGAGGRPVLLADAYRVRGATPALRREATIRAVQRALRAAADAKTGVINLSVSAPDPVVAQSVNVRLISLLNTFNLDTRQSQAAAERRFTERRLSDVRSDLRAAENRLQTFLQQNRVYSGSPELTFAQDRLAREVSMQQQLFTTLAQAYEQAKIEEVRDTPVITVLVRPEVPVLAESRGSTVKIGAGVALGLVLGLVLATVRSARRRAEQGGAPDDVPIAALWDALLADLRRPWRLVVARRAAGATPPAGHARV